METKSLNHESVKGYVYSLWSGRLLIKEAVIIKYQEPSRHVGLSRAKFSDGKYVVVNEEPSQIYNGIVWLPEQSDDIAVEMLIEYQNMQIAKLKEKIGNHEYKIETLKNALKSK
jgi:hypothetical protein